jgi:hypothetical protein
LARAKALMADIHARLEVAAKLANADTSFQEEIPLNEPAPDDIADQVAEYFQLDTNKSTIAVAKFVEE